MSKILDLKKAYGDKLDEMEAAAENEAEFEAFKVEADKIKGQIERAVDLEKRRAENAVEHKSSVNPTTGAPTVPAAVDSTPSYPGQNIARLMISLASSKGSPTDALRFAQKTWGNSADAVCKALAASVNASGGFLVPQDFRAELIEMLRPASVVFRGGPRLLEMPNGNITLPRMTTGASANYVGENTNIPPSEETFDQVVMAAKKLAALVPISNDMLRYPTPTADRFVRDDMIAAISQATDLQLIRGAGSATSPRGMRAYVALVAATNSFVANATGNVVNVTADLAKLELALMNANIPQTKLAWLMSPRSKIFLGNLRDGNSLFVFPSLNDAVPYLRGKPVLLTTQIPSNLGVGTNESEVYLIDFDQFIIGESITLELATFDGAAYWDGTAVVSAASLDQTVMRAITAHDTAMRQARAVAMLNSVIWVP